MKVLTSLAVLLLVLTGPLYAVDMDGLVLHLAFNEGAGTVASDSSGTGNDGELVGDVQWVDGLAGSGALYISGSAAENMVVVPDDDTLDITDAMTISIWANIEANPDGSNSLITKADTYMIHTSDWSGNGLEQELLLWPFAAWQTTASTPIQPNEWSHVVGTFDGSLVKMYIDGEFMGEVEWPNGQIAVTESDLVIGRDSRSCCAGRISTLTIDDVMLFSRALSDAEVMELFNNLPTAVEPDGLLTTSWGELKQ